MASATGTVTTDSKDEAFPYMRPAKLKRWEALKLDIWNPSTKAFLGRDAKSWGGIILFYLIFYAALAAFFAVCMKGLLYTIDEREPTYIGDSSLIGNNPGMGFRPISRDVDITGSLVWYEAKNQTDVDYWVDILDEFTAPYYNETIAQSLMVCDYDRPVTEQKGCIVNTTAWGNCTPQTGYNFNRSRPCFFIKLNKVYGWVPDYFKSSDELPQEMPSDLKEHIENISATDPKMLNGVWISCTGENPADNENIGPVNYVSGRSIPGYYFPYKNQDNYLAPVIVIQFENPKKHVLINIECKAWAKNIRIVKQRSEREGSVHVELMVD